LVLHKDDIMTSSNGFQGPILSQTAGAHAGYVLTSDAFGNGEWGPVGGTGAVTSVSDNGNGTLTINPTTGAVLAAINLASANTWTGAITINAGSSPLVIYNPAGTQYYTIVPQAIAGNYNLQLPAISGTDTLASLGMANAWTQAQTFNAGAAPLVIYNPAGTQYYTIVPQAIAGNYNLQLPAISGTDTLASLGMANAWTQAQTFSATAVFSSGITGPTTQGIFGIYTFRMQGGTSGQTYQTASPYQLGGGASTTTFNFGQLADGGNSTGYNY
jgi:hypothetical protein